jgi:hypothetical protein
VWPYIITFVAVAVFPLLLAGYAGRLAVLAMPDEKNRKKAHWIVWGLAGLGVVVFGVSQVLAFRADTARDVTDNIRNVQEESFRGQVLADLSNLIGEPNSKKMREDAISLKAKIATDSQSAPDDTPKTHHTVAPTNRVADQSHNAPQAPLVPLPAVVPVPVRSDDPRQLADTLPLACPPAGTVKPTSWQIGISTLDRLHDYYFPVRVPQYRDERTNPIPPLLRGGFDAELNTISGSLLNAHYTKLADALFAEVSSYAPRADALKTAEGDVHIEELALAINRDLSNGSNVISIGFSSFTPNKHFIANTYETVAVEKLTRTNKEAIAEFDKLANRAVEEACPRALHKFVAP